MKPMSNEEYRVAFKQLTKDLYAKFAVEYTPYDMLLDAIAAVENEMNRNGGCNWNTGDYDEYLVTIHEHLDADPEFSDAEAEKIAWALNELVTCGEELEKDGHSSRNVEDPIDYLIARVVDWCQRHPPPKSEDAPGD